MTEPIYRRVASVLRREIQDGTWHPGERLPTLPELQQRFEVSRITVRGAIDELVRENLVRTAGSRGTIVRSTETLDHIATAPLRADREQSSHDVFMETANRAGRLGSKDFSMAIEPAPTVAAVRLGMAPGDWTVRRSILQWLDGEPWSWETSWFPAELARLTGIDAAEDIPEGTTRRLVERGYGEVGWIDESTTAAATPDEAHMLGISAGTPLSHLIRTGATSTQVTRVTWTRRIAAKNRTIHELGADEGLAVILAARGASR